MSQPGSSSCCGTHILASHCLQYPAKQPCRRRTQSLECPANQPRLRHPCPAKQPCRRRYQSLQYSANQPRRSYPCPAKQPGRRRTQSLQYPAKHEQSCRSYPCPAKSESAEVCVKPNVVRTEEPRLNIMRSLGCALFVILRMVAKMTSHCLRLARVRDLPPQVS